MGRPSKLTPEQWREVEGRFLGGEGSSALAREFGIDEAAIRRKFRRDTPIVRIAAEKLAEGQRAVAELPKALQPVAIDLAAKLRNVGASLASAAELGAATSHRLAAIANAQAQQIDDVNPMETQEVLQAISALTKISNDASVLGVALINAGNKGAKSVNESSPSKPTIIRIVGGDGE